jgi:hypothetical protein
MLLLSIFISIFMYMGLCKFCKDKISCKKVYCNAICMEKHYRKDMIKLNCLTCNKEYFKSLSQKSKYCSPSCYTESRIGKKRPEHSKKMKGKKTNLGRKLTKAQRLKMSGVNHWRYGKGKGFNSLKERIRKLTEYNDWRFSVYVRDGFTCTHCNLKDVRLECHHVKSYSSIVSENNIETVNDALMCDELWDINNGLTLCKECHKKTDSYGRNKGT